ncbi:MAG TPA: RDD family protein, partial [Acidimicrobiales bacterium]|nr:RDD family protein [Acidimicrobiales bacterium]
GGLAVDADARGGGPADPHELQRRDVSGHYAGPVTRILSVVADVAAVVTLNAGLAAVIAFFVGSILGADLSSRATAILSLGSLSALFLAWFWPTVALFGRTPAMALLGIAVVSREGGVVGGARALVRALVLPVSILVPVLFLGLVLGRERRTLHDLVAGTTVVYDWGAREAEQPVTIREQLSARVRRRELDGFAASGRSGS